MFEVSATLPTRVDLAGGTIDLWPIHNVLPKSATVNVGIGLMASSTVKTLGGSQFRFTSLDQKQTWEGSYSQLQASGQLGLFGLLTSSIWSQELPPVSIETMAESPAGAGLGGSSALAVSILSALNKLRSLIDKSFKPLSEDQIVNTAKDVESLVIFAPTGIQDYWGAIRGGLNVIDYKFGSTSVTTFDSSLLSESEYTLIACYSGKSRASAINNWEIFKRVFDRDEALISKLVEIGTLAWECGQSIKAGKIKDAIDFSRKEWLVRTKLWPNIHSPETKTLEEAAQKNGAIVSRVCGAGGGGVMGIFCAKDDQLRIEKALTESGGALLKSKLGVQGKISVVNV
jgi:D-glycero-alpha-D-manno-heptose-7-phosphate kinase